MGMDVSPKQDPILHRVDASVGAVDGRDINPIVKFI